jgi:hypothetical protein
LMDSLMVLSEPTSVARVCEWSYEVSLGTPRDAGVASGSPGAASACPPRSPRFGQRGFKLLDGVVGQLRTRACVSNLIRGPGMLSKLIAELGV